MGPVEGKVSLWGKNITDTQYFSEILPGSVIGFGTATSSRAINSSR